jgi:hypothetical protein
MIEMENLAEKMGKVVQATLDEIGSVELEFIRHDLSKFIHGKPYQRDDRAPLVRAILSDHRMKDLDGYLAEGDSQWKIPIYLFNRASEAFDEIERILGERAAAEKRERS